MELVTVFRTFNPGEAELIRSRLDAAEFDVTLTHSLASLSLEGYALAAGGILVQVPDTEAQDAKDLLAARD
ncbi:MAG TPA: DUF2007 domain-containing protein [Methylomirabilota bacterium]|nr:DUF2007 domain-containing protein [Methylomirabilota bacterium]